MNEFKNLDDMAKDAGEFIADSANKAKEAVVDAWPSEEIDKFGEDIKEKANQISEKADKDMKLAKEAVNETSDEFVESVMKSKDSAKDAWNEYVHDINIDDIKISEDIKNTVNKIDSYFRDNESGDIDAQDLGQYGDIDPYYYYHSRHDGQGIYINSEGLFEYNSVEETYASASYFSSCMMSLSQGDVYGFNETLKGQLHEIYSDSKFTNLLATQFNLEESEISGVIDELVDKTIETAQTVNYLQFRVAVGAVQIAENVYKGVAVPYEKLKGNDEKANGIMSESFTDEIREAGEEAYNQNEVSQLVGDVAEEFGEEATECAVAVVALTTGTGSVAAVAATAGTTSILAFNNMGESLENSYELQGEVTDEAVLAAEITGAATVVATGVGSQINNKLSMSEANIARKIAKIENINEKIGGRITGTLVHAAYGANFVGTYEMPEKVDKVVKAGLGIDNNVDVQSEVKDYVSDVAVAAAVAGGAYYLSNRIKDTRTFNKVVKLIKGENYVATPDKYESIFKKVCEIEDYKIQYVKEIKNYTEVPDTLNDLNIGELENTSPEIVQEKRRQFNNIKDTLIKEWENTYGQPWPTYQEDIYNEFGELVKKKGWKYDAHHIKPLSMGGDNTAENITPLSYDVHSDHNGVHATDSAFGKLDSLLKGVVK